jgi:hypothetical protein
MSGHWAKQVPTAEELIVITESYRQNQHVDVGFGVVLQTAPEQQSVFITLITPHEKQNFILPYGGTPDYASLWALNQSLNIIRRI